MLLFTLPGTAVFYAGDELGMCGGSIDAERVLDPFERQLPGYGLNRDPERTPMQWNGGAHAGFTTAKPWLPVGDHIYRNVEAENADACSLLNLYRRLITMRRSEPALAGSGYTTVQDSDDIFAYTRAHANRRILVALNFSARGRSCYLPGAGGGRVLLSTQLDRIDEIATDRVRLPSNEGLIIALADGEASETTLSI